jgi:hypothetical protein
VRAARGRELDEQRSHAAGGGLDQHAVAGRHAGASSSATPSGTSSSISRGAAARSA